MNHKTWVVFNEKGGAGKTTTTLNIYGILTKAGYSVVVVDLDQGGKAIDVIAQEGQGSLAERVVSARDGAVDYVEQLILDASVKFEADYVLIDCPPKFSEEWNTANTLGDEFIVPGKPSLIDRALTIKTALMIARMHPNHVYILPTEVDMREKTSQQAMDDYTNLPQTITTLPIIRRAALVARSMEEGKPVIEVDANAEVTLDYNDAVAIVMGDK